MSLLLLLLLMVAMLPVGVVLLYLVFMVLDFGRSTSLRILRKARPHR